VFCCWTKELAEVVLGLSDFINDVIAPWYILAISEATKWANKRACEWMQQLASTWCITILLMNTIPEAKTNPLMLYHYSPDVFEYVIRVRKCL
jgi:hypothetical protein